SPTPSGLAYPNGNSPPEFDVRGQAAPHPGQGNTSQGNAPRSSMPTQEQQTAVISALPPEDQPETGPARSLPPQFRRTLITYQSKEPARTIIIDTPADLSLSRARQW